MKDKPADGVALNARLPDSDMEALRKFHEDPIVFQIVRLYAREHGVNVEDILYGSREVAVEAPRLGYHSVADAARAQKQLNKALRRSEQ